MNKLTKRTVDAAEVGASDYIIWDGELPGLRTARLPVWQAQLPGSV